LRDALVVAEMAMAVVLMVCAGLLIRSFTKIVNRDPGVAVDHVLAARVSLPDARYPKDDDAIRFFERLTRELAGQPGIASASATSYLPAGGGGFGPGRVVPQGGQAGAPASHVLRSHRDRGPPRFLADAGHPAGAGPPVPGGRPGGGPAGDRRQRNVRTPNVPRRRCHRPPHPLVARR